MVVWCREVKLNRKQNKAAKGLTRRFAACAALVAFALLSFVSAPVRADEVQWAGVTIAYTNAVVTYSNPDDLDVSDLILTYTDTTTPGSLTLPEEWSVRYLVVGGGGAGGTVLSTDANKGQGGGGGAGGFLTGDANWAGQSYSIYVGAGGLPADAQTIATPGGDGGGSAITNTTTAAEVACARGGGGGGAQSDGRAGGSGGGGSCLSNAATHPGGAGTAGQGNAGGAGNNVRQAAGGGGAGASGGNTSSGSGGIGLQSDITGTLLYYAGGGGGGRSQGTPAHAGGQGGGGYGGTGANNDESAAAPGEEATGGGGGGGGRYRIGAAGGSGIVVIRLLMPAIAPSIKAAQSFTGAALSAIDEDSQGSNWDYASGTMVATNKGDYTFSVVPKPGLRWKDNGGTEARSFNWQIIQAVVPAAEVPTGTNLVYNGEEQIGSVPASSGYYTLSNEKQMTVGTYTVTATLNNPSGTINCTWPGGSTDPKQFTFTISKRILVRPTAKSGLTYTGSPQNGIDDSSDVNFYVLDGTTNATLTGDYTATATIGTVHHGNCEWADGDPAASGDSVDIPWRIGGQPVPKPTANDTLVYNFSNQVGIVTHGSENQYTIVNTNATDAGGYTAVATLVDPANYQWEDTAYGVDQIEIPWSIAQLPIEPAYFDGTTNFVYDTNDHFVVVAPADWIKYSHLESSSVTNETNAGSYQATFVLDSANYIWDTDPRTTASLVVEWRIDPAPVNPPSAVDRVYNGTIQYGIVHSDGQTRYHLYSGTMGATDARDYQATFVLNDPANNYWSTGGTDAQTFNWSITQAPNAITVLRLPSWKVEENPVVHPVDARATWRKDAGEPHIDYSSSLDGPWVENQPTNVGIYYVRATVAETTNWAAAERAIKFSIWSDPDRIFRDYVDLRVQGYRGEEPLTNFPLLVRISESRLRGFFYSRAGNTGEDMVFMDPTTDTQMPYEVDTWNVNGESLVWVRVGVLTNDAPIRMYWTLREGELPPGYTPEDVWADYVGVWHFADLDGEPSSDATGNGNFAYPYTHNSSETTSTMIHGTANIGQGRTISMNKAAAGGCRLVVSNTPSFYFDGKLTISGWLKMSTAPSGAATLTEGHVWPFSRRNVESASGTDLGAYLLRASDSNLNLRGMRLFGGGSSGGEASQIWPAQVLSAWSYFGAAYNDTSAKVCGAQMGNSNFVTRSLSVTPPADSGENLAFGNIPGNDDTYYSFAGMVDEYRLTDKVRSPGWLQAEFDTVNDTAFCTNSLVVKDGLKVNYWTDYPAFAPLAMEAGEYPTVCYNGRLAEGWASTNYVNIYDSTTNSVYPTAGGSYRVVFSLDESYTGYELLEPEKGYFNLTLNGRSPYDDIAGNLGDSGRILLMNRHRIGTQDVVNRQGYAYNTTDRPAAVDENTFWQLVSSSPANNIVCPNLRPATESILWTQQYGTKLWHLINCRHGNTVNEVDRKPKFENNQNYLSFSSSSYSIDGRESSRATALTAGQIVMRNWIGTPDADYQTAAAVYSPCYDDGIGTVYFDAVNGWTGNIGNNYCICVEVCTNVLGDASALLPPTDDNIMEMTLTVDEQTGDVTTNIEYFAKAVWQPVPFIAYKRDNTNVFVREDVPATGINLAIEHGGTTTNFYRIAVPLDIRTPARFRIRRTTYDSSILVNTADGNALILLDNILVSYPAMSADLKPLGKYDPDRRGKQVLGQELAMETPFPAQTDTDVFARAQPYYYVNPGVAGADSNNFVVAANLHYRWRYLRQRAVPTVGEDHGKLDPAYSQYYSDSFWRSVPLNPKGGYHSVDPLDLPAAAGDVEFWYELTMNTPYYEYVDYSGLDYGVPYDERHTAVTNHMTAAERDGGNTLLPSTGVDWFVRLREGKSDYEGAQVVVSGVINGVYEMDPIEDNMWRALVKIPVDTAGQLSFSFVGLNRQSRGATEFVENTDYFGPHAAETSALPGSGRLEEYDDPAAVKKVTIDIDNTTGYIEFKFSDRFLTWGASRAEYQNFNNWSDAHRTDQKFCVASGTNGVDDIAMKTYSAVTNMNEWDEFVPSSGNWNDTFYLANYNDPGFPKETFYQDHVTPNAWNGHNLTFVSKEIKRYYAPTEADPYSGIAAKLQGCGDGYIDFTHTDRPLGLAEVSVAARIGQSISFDTMSYSETSMFKVDISGTRVKYYSNTNYVFFAPVIMANNVANPYIYQGNQMAPGAAVSVVAYYWPGVGCYEFRISRLSNNDNNANNFTGNCPRYVLALYRWSNVGGKMVATLLRSQAFQSTNYAYGTRLWGTPSGNGSLSTTTPNKDNPRYWGMFISVQNTPTGTLVIGGVSDTADNNTYNSFGSQMPVYGDAGNINPAWNSAQNGVSQSPGLPNGYRGIAYRDDSGSKLTYGAYGVAAKDCAARFIGMHHYDSPTPPGNITYAAEGSYVADHNPPAAGKSRFFNNFNGNTSVNRYLRISESDPVAEWPDLVEGVDLRWALQGQLQRYHPNLYPTAAYAQAYRGLCMPTDLSQDVVLKLQAAGSGDWEERGRKAVSGYGLTTVKFPLHITGEWNTRVTSGDNNVELVVASITQDRWEAPDYEEIRWADDDFVYTQGIVSTNTTLHQQELLLQPSRGKLTEPMSMRAPMIRGLGKISFTYAGADADAEIWVQIATNDVANNISTLNYSLKESPSDWITVGKYAAKEKSGYNGKLVVGGVGSVTHYVGIHDRRDLPRPLRGIFRILVPTNVIIEAHNRAYLTTNVDYGKLTIRGMTVTDEPGLSDRSWRGWNMRTVGDASDTEYRMYLPDTTLAGEDGSGLVGALNNSVNNIDEDDPERAKTEYPTIFSPTFKVEDGRKNGVGSVDFRARLYSNSSASTATASQSKGGKVWLYGSTSSIDGPWMLLQEYTIDSQVMKTYSWQTGDENYLAIKFAIADPSAKTTDSEYERIVIDEITIREKVQPSVGFLYARPFRNYLFDPIEVADILSPSEQPIVGESWGVQTKVLLRQLADDIDTDRGFTVSLSYYTGDKWGYPQWRNEPEAVSGIELIPVGDPTNLVFRSVGTSEETLVPPAQEGGVVQYQLTINYYDRGGRAYHQTLEAYSDWEQPTWYYPIDKNVDAGGNRDPKFFSPYTILDAVSPGRAWINEFNFNDGTAAANGGVKPVDNQFIELCIPSGIDMSGWKLRLTDLNYSQWVMAKLGFNGLPASKLSPTSTNNFEFYLLESPATDLAGGINRRTPGAPEADGTWNNDGRTANAKDGTVVNEYPYQLELIRPNGIIEHQIVFEGTNTVARRSYGYLYSATNLAYQLELDEDPVSPKRMVVGSDLDRATTDPTAYGSSGVIGGDASGEPAPGDAETWVSGLQFTPGWLNEGQIIPYDWYVSPNGTNCWVYFVNQGAHIVQFLGTNSAPYMVAVVTKDQQTNITYQVAKWYAVNVEENGQTTATGERGTYVHYITPTSTTYRVVATETANPDLAGNYELDEDNPYTDSVLNWLTSNWPEYDSEDIRLARFQGLNNTSTNIPLSLTEMYWLDIPPVPVTEEERNSPDGGSNWWLRAGITKSPVEHKIYRTRGGETICFTNHVVDMTMYISNSVTLDVHAPQRLQGLDNAQSDRSGSGAWTSETFKVRAKLDLGWETKFLPFRNFVFGPGSFTGAGGGSSANVPSDPISPDRAIAPYTARIEILDPYSSDSIGRSYGWQNYPSTSCFFLWSIDTEIYNLLSVQTLKADDTYPTTQPTP